MELHEACQLVTPELLSSGGWDYNSAAAEGLHTLLLFLLPPAAELHRYLPAASGKNQEMFNEHKFILIGLGLT